MGFVENVKRLPLLKEFPDKLLALFGHEGIVAYKQDGETIVCEQAVHRPLVSLRCFLCGVKHLDPRIESDIRRHVFRDFISVPVALNSRRSDNKKAIDLAFFVEDCSSVDDGFRLGGSLLP